MAQEAPNEGGHLVLPNGGDDNRVIMVPQFGRVKAQVAGEQSRAPEPSKQDNNLFVGEAFSPRVNTDLPDSDVPALQKQALPFEDVLVQENQACTGWSTYSRATYWLE